MESNIYFCNNIPLNNSYNHTIRFADISSQRTYFVNKSVYNIQAHSYIRKSWSLKVGVSFETARTWDYLFFNNGLGEKTWYYFITNIEYLNDNTVELQLEIDVLQSYMFDYNHNPCFVEREHSVTDNIGDNTVEESFELGEFLTAKKETIDLTTDLSILVASPIDMITYVQSNGETELKIAGQLYDGIFGGLQIITAPTSDQVPIRLFLQKFDDKPEAIFAIWQYPSRLMRSNKGSYGNDTSLTFEYVTGSYDITHVLESQPASIDGYYPKNKKLFQYPYTYLYVTNNSGGACVYKYEYFDLEVRTIHAQGNISPDAVVKIYPKNYKGVTENVDEALTMTSFPICSWNNDPYKSWLAQTQNTQNFGYAMSALKIVGGVGTAIGGTMLTGGVGTGVAIGTGASMVTSGISDIMGQLAQKADKEVQPPQAKGVITGSHNVAQGQQNFDIYHKTIDRLHAKIIDDYFSMFGYAVKQVKVPNIHSRPNWNYIKTIGCNITGNMCQQDKNTINSIFNKGVTFWNHGNIVGNYNLDNSVGE